MREDLARDVGGWKVHACVMHSYLKVSTRAAVDVMTDQDLRILARGGKSLYLSGLGGCFFVVSWAAS